MIGKITILCPDIIQYYFALQKLYAEYELQGITEEKLNSQHWQSFEQRMVTEEAACALTGADLDENG